MHGLNAAFDGVHPATNHLGLPWPAGSPQADLAGSLLCNGGVRVVVYTLTGDLEYLGVEFGFPHFNSLSPCWFCPASRAAGSPHSLTDLQRAVGWKSNLVSDAE